MTPLTRKLWNMLMRCLVVSAIIIFVTNWHKLDKIDDGHMKDVFDLSKEGFPSVVSVYDLKNTPQRDDFNCTDIPTISQPVKICMESKYDVDLAISSLLKKNQESIEIYMDILRKNPDLGVIDVGSHHGLFTLLAAILGGHVYSVEMRLQHVKMIYASTMLNKFADQVLLLHNAVSDQHQLVPEELPDKNDKEIKETPTVKSITLDDIIPLMKHRKVLLKLDNEPPFQALALLGAGHFLNTVHVPYIIMKWESVPKEHQAQLIGFMKDTSYEAYDCSKQELVNNKHMEWPKDIVWKHVTVSF